MEKKYNPSFEGGIYQKWLDNKCFTPKVDESKEPFTTVMPPPNITGQLHMGHALDQTIQDILIRFKRMQGYSTLYLPGTDHASIATEVKIIEQLNKEGIKKEDLGREEFLKKAWEWKEKYAGRIKEQIKRLGSSCDWTREAFTMDENLSNAVKDTFVRYYKKGLIYRGERITNWCPCCKTALSDAEVEYKEEQSNLWHYKYYFENSNEYLIIATTRPETMLGDTAVAVNPKDTRMNSYIGRNLKLPLTDRVIPVIADKYVEMEFGTGAVKITPAHDPNDFEIGKRHDLPIIRVIDENGNMNENAGKYCGLSREECRKQVVADLEEQGYMVKIEPYAHNVGHCYRCHTIIESLISKQWYVKMKELAEPAIREVKNKKIEFTPSRFSKVYYNWMENIKDWCISRQLWWGHRIPAYYCQDCGHVHVSKNEVVKCTKCASENIVQDDDVLDTWFSSALWPFSTLGYPKKTKELKYFYPTNVLVTGYDIIFFWVARMIFSGIELMEEVPFSDVLIHGLVRDEQGRKMSKSLNNGIDPIEIIDEYGADALRFSLSSGVAAGSDMRFSKTRIESARNFANKLWNASRFVLMNCDVENTEELPKRLNIVDKWILSKMNILIKDMTIALNKFDIGFASGRIYDFVWSEFCDWYIEISKPLLNSNDNKQKLHAVTMLKYVLVNVLKLLHPFMPFITEEIYSMIYPDKILMTESWPEYQRRFSYKNEMNLIDSMKELIVSIRNVRNTMGVAPNRKIEGYILNSRKKEADVIIPFLDKLAGVEKVTFVDSVSEIKQEYNIAISNSLEIYIPIDNLIDREKELVKLEKEYVSVENDVKRLEVLLSNKNFTSRAPLHLIQQEQEKLSAQKERLIKLHEKMEVLKK